MRSTRSNKNRHTADFSKSVLRQHIKRLSCSRLPNKFVVVSGAHLSQMCPDLLCAVAGNQEAEDGLHST